MDIWDIHLPVNLFYICQLQFRHLRSACLQLQGSDDLSTIVFHTALDRALRSHQPLFNANLKHFRHLSWVWLIICHEYWPAGLYSAKYSITGRIYDDNESNMSNNLGPIFYKISRHRWDPYYAYGELPWPSNQYHNLTSHYTMKFFVIDRGPYWAKSWTGVDLIDIVWNYLSRAESCRDETWAAPAS